MDCAKCKGGIRGETGIKCEGVCGKVYHLALKCSGIDTYTAVKLNEISMLRYICEDCIVYIQNVDGILKEMHKAVEKNNKYLREYKKEFDIAINNNERIVKKMMDEIKMSFDAKLKEIENVQKVCEKNFSEVKNLNKTAENIKENSDKICVELEINKSENKKINDEIRKLTNNNKNVTNKMSFAEIAKSALPKGKNDKPLIIRPKNKQNSEKTKNDLNNKVDPTEFKISNVIIKRNGVAVVESTNDNEREKIMKVMEQKLNNEYEIKIPAISSPKINIAKMTYKHNNEQLVEKLKRQNDFIANDNIQVVKQYEVKKSNGSFYNAIIKTSVETFNKIMSVGKLNIGWERCKVYDELSIISCYKCKAYGHKVENCKNEDVCIKCLKNHRTNDCDKEHIINA